MKKHALLSSLLLTIFLGLSFACSRSPTPEVIAVYLTWLHEPQSTMTVMWISLEKNPQDTILYRERSSTEWVSASGVHNVLPEGRHDLLIHCVELTNLKPDSTYLFKINSLEKHYSFHTLPDHLTDPLNFIVGGDLYNDSIDILRDMHQQSKMIDPSFALLGGDIAYAAPRNPNAKEDVNRWVDFWKLWQEEMVTSDGCLIPVLATTSNSDTKGRYGNIPANAPCFYAFLRPAEGKGYQVVDFGDYLSVWILDSGHTTHIKGEQADWLKSTLEKRQDMPHKIAAYHVPAYPSYRSYEDVHSVAVRENWVPFFEKFGMHVAFEHHDHDYKRSHLIKDCKVNPQGVLYLGDGAYGVSSVRAPEDRWYIAYSAMKKHFYAVTLTPDKRIYRGIDDKGVVFDQFEQHVD